MIAGCEYCDNGTPHHHTEESLLAEVQRLHGVCRDQSKRSQERVDRWVATADEEREAKEAALKQRDEAYAKLDATVLQNQELQKQLEQWKNAACGKYGKCGLHCNCYNDIDWDKPGCQWCQILQENAETLEKWVADREKLEQTNRLNDELKEALAQCAVAMETAECHGQHEDCTRCERIRWLRAKSEKPKEESENCPNCTYMRFKGHVCTKCGFIEKRNPVVGRADEEPVKAVLSPKNCPNCNGYSYHADKCPNG